MQLYMTDIYNLVGISPPSYNHDSSWIEIIEMVKVLPLVPKLFILEIPLLVLKCSSVPVTVFLEQAVLFLLLHYLLLVYLVLRHASQMFSPT